MVEITFNVAVFTSFVAKITFVVEVTTFKVAVIAYSLTINLNVNIEFIKT